MATAYKTPGVYREDVYVRPAADLPTGVPGFVGFGKAKTNGGPVMLHRAEDLAARFAVSADVGSYLADSVTGFFANGGTICYVVGANTTGNREAALKEAIDRLGPLPDLDLVAVPDAMVLSEEAALRVQKAVLAHCDRHGNRFAILDAPAAKDPATGGPAALKTWRNELVRGGNNPANAALYYPWVKIPASGTSGDRAIPPCGYVAGIYARSDARRGVFKAPANEELLGLLDLEYAVETSAQDSLNPQGINCLRWFSGRGLRVWGARTISPDPNWRYVNVRRLFLTLTRWIDRNLTWTAFEPNTARLWNRITREISVHLDRLWRDGALRGTTATEAYYVKCDAETNPSEHREQGRVITEIGLAAAQPAEFIVTRIVHRAGSTELSP